MVRQKKKQANILRRKNKNKRTTKTNNTTWRDKSEVTGICRAPHVCTIMAHAPFYCGTQPQLGCYKNTLSHVSIHPESVRAWGSPPPAVRLKGIGITAHDVNTGFTESMSDGLDRVPPKPRSVYQKTQLVKMCLSPVGQTVTKYGKYWRNKEDERHLDRMKQYR